MKPTRIVATKKNGLWTARLSDGENVACGSGETYQQAIDGALAQPDGILYRQICGDLRRVPQF